MLDEVAWLFNIRGSDVSFNPVVIAYAVITLHQGIHIFINKTKLSSEVIQYLTTPAVTGTGATGSYDLTIHVHDYDDITTYLHDLVLKHPTFKMMIDPTQLNWKLYQCFEQIEPNDSSSSSVSSTPEQRIKECANPITLRKSIKNNFELNGIRQAHIRDGVALTAFLYYLENRVQNASNTHSDSDSNGNHTKRAKLDPSTTSITTNDSISEYQVTEVLEAFRQKMADHVSPSFDTIAGSM